MRAQELTSSIALYLHVPHCPILNGKEGPLWRLMAAAVDDADDEEVNPSGAKLMKFTYHFTI